MKKNNCPYCGNNQVPHFLNWYFESLNVFFTPLRTLLLFNPVSRSVSRFVARLNFSFLITQTAKAFGIISFQTDRTACKVSRALVLWEEAERRGIVMKELLLFGRPFDTYMARKELVVSSKELGGKKTKVKTIIFSGLPRPEGYDDTALDTLDDKLALKKKLSAAGLPVPAGGSAYTFSQALKIFRNIAKPVIVKPRAGSRGRHSTTHIYTEEDLQKAFRIAKQLCFWVIVEEHIFGPVYRATLIDFKLRGVLRGDSPQVVGDGTRTITELVEAKNSASHEGVKNIVLDDRAAVYLLRQKLTTESIPSKGQTVTLSEKIGVNYGGSSSEDISVCHPDTKELFAAAARIMGDPIVGFDYITSDITKSYKEQKTGFIEANSLPFINLHHDPLLGTPQNVAQYVWELVGM